MKYLADVRRPLNLFTDIHLCRTWLARVYKSGRIRLGGGVVIRLGELVAQTRDGNVPGVHAVGAAYAFWKRFVYYWTWVVPIVLFVLYCFYLCFPTRLWALHEGPMRFSYGPPKLPIGDPMPVETARAAQDDGQSHG